MDAELTLRRLLWLHHGHSRLYGDDGEMQCSECPLDFKRDAVQRIEEVFTRRALLAASSVTPDREYHFQYAGSCYACGTPKCQLVVPPTR